MIQTHAITKRFDRLQILKGIDIEVHDREIVAIVGPSGAGKTTLLQIVGTLDRPDSGHVIIDGVDPFTLNERRMAAFRNQHIGFVFQFHRLLPEFTALENVMIPALIARRKKSDPDDTHNSPEAQERWQRAADHPNEDDRAAAREFVHKMEHKLDLLEKFRQAQAEKKTRSIHT